MNTNAVRESEPTVSSPPAADADPAAVRQVMGQLMTDLAATSGMLLTTIVTRLIAGGRIRAAA